MPDGRADPAVSVVVPFFNVRAFLAEAIESVFAQTFGGWELLLIDDGSTDGSTDVAKAWAARAPDRVRCLEHEQRRNRGVAASRNLGIRQACGRYIAFLDSDDVWFPGKLERQLAILSSQPRASMICGPSEFWYSWSGKPEDRDRDYVKDLRVGAGLIEPPALLISYLTRGNFVANPSTLLVRREVFDRVGGFEESFLGPVQTWEDVAFLSKVQLSEPILVAAECWVRYRRHDRSLLSVMVNSGQLEAGRAFYLQWLNAYLDSRQIQSPEVRQAVHRAMWPIRHPLLHRMGEAARSVSRRKFRVLLDKVTGRVARGFVSPRPGTPVSGEPRRLAPISRRLGRDRGLPIDRYYIERFLSRHSEWVAGVVLEIGDDRYTRKIGGPRVTQSEILHVTSDNARATIVADLTRGDAIPSNHFDCIILTQTLTFIFDLRAAVFTLHRILKPGGVVLATMGGITQTIRSPTDRWDYQWGFTTHSARLLFEERFPPAAVHVESFGNVLAATAFLQGLATEDLRPEELDHHDPDYEFLIGVTAVKPPATGSG
jgi:glycosyltransferase involved in cell wall biosynthesis